MSQHTQIPCAVSGALCGAAHRRLTRLRSKVHHIKHKVLHSIYTCSHNQNTNYQTGALWNPNTPFDKGSWLDTMRRVGVWLTQYSLWEEDRGGLEGEWGGGGEVVCACGGVGLALGTGAGAASTSGAGAAGALRTLLTRSVSRDTECSPGKMDGWMGDGGTHRNRLKTLSEGGRDKEKRGMNTQGNPFRNYSSL